MQFTDAACSKGNVKTAAANPFFIELSPQKGVPLYTGVFERSIGVELFREIECQTALDQCSRKLRGAKSRSTLHEEEIASGCALALTITLAGEFCAEDIQAFDHGRRCEEFWSVRH